MPASRKLLAAASCALLAACVGKVGETQPDGGSGSYALTLIGTANPCAAGSWHGRVLVC